MKKLILSLAILTTFLLLNAEIIIEHNPEITIDEGSVLDVQLDIISGFSEINSVFVLYRQQGELTFIELEMEKGSETEARFTARLEEAAAYQSAVEYFFQIKDMKDQLSTVPAFQAENNAYRVAIAPPVLTLVNEGFVLLSPDLEYSEITNDFVVAISYFAIQDEIDINSIQLIFDGNDVSAGAEISSNMLVYNVTNASNGMHMYKITAKLLDGAEIESEVWRISIKDYSLKQKLNLSGKAIFRSNYSSKKDDVDTDTDKWANFLLQFGGEYNWLKFKSKIFVSSLETSNAQAVNRYNLSFYTKYFNLIGGDYTPNYGTFIMSSKNIMGVHSNLHFKYFRLKSTWGQSKRAVKYGNGTYTRNSIGIRTEVGSEDLFSWGFAVAKNKDDKTSISDSYYDNDTASPDDNIVIGTDFTLSLLKRKLLWGAEVALSYLNTNIYDGAMSLEEMEDSLDTEINLPFDPLDFEDIFVINDNVEPIIPGLSSLAYKTYLRAFFYNNFLNINYSAVGTSFNSYSSNFLQKDNAILSINDNVNLFNNKLFLSMNLSLTSDNIYDTKDVTTKSTNYSTQAMYRINNKSYVKLGYMGNESANDDSLVYEFSTQNITIGGGYHLKNLAVAPTRFNLSYNKYINSGENEVVTDVTLGTTETNEYETNKDNINFSIDSDFTNIPLETIISFTFSTTDNLSSETDYKSLFLKGMLSLNNKKLLPYASFNYTKLGGDYDKNSVAFNLGTNYYLWSRTHLTTDIGAKMYADNDIADGSQDFSLYTWRLKITQSF
jgi:hypothetical protein